MMGTNMRANNPNLDDAREFSRDDPRRALDIENRYIAENPSDSHGYFSRHLTWAQLGAYDKALADCSKAIDMLPKTLRYLARSEIHRALGNHAEALADLNRAHDMDRDEWLHSFGPHVRADTLARLGRLDEALADAALLPEDHWMPAHDGLPGGDKRQFIAEIRRRAAARNGRP
jgi:tetratricopeptide (TPR) repeat protein